MGKLTQQQSGISTAAQVLVLTALVLGSSVYAQSAANFDVKTIAPDAAAPKLVKGKAEATAGRETTPVGTIPSRNVSGAEFESYTESLGSVLLIRGRTTDPFGQIQDPDAKPVIKASAIRSTQRVAPVQVMPFSEIVGMITVTTIMPGEKKFLVGTRSFTQGDQIPLYFRSRQIRCQITEVTSRQIGFRNLDTGETASRKLDMLPVGMTPGNRGITAPGMVPESNDAPINLDAEETAP